VRCDLGAANTEGAIVTGDSLEVAYGLDL
jgi:hypothetical protein